MQTLSAFPGGDFISVGLEDLASGRLTVASLLVSIGAQRLRDAGLDVSGAFDDPEGRLYDLLAKDDADSAHRRYNALIRRLVNFERTGMREIATSDRIASVMAALGDAADRATRVYFTGGVTAVPGWEVRSENRRSGQAGRLLPGDRARALSLSRH